MCEEVYIHSESRTPQNLGMNSKLYHHLHAVPVDEVHTHLQVVNYEDEYGYFYMLFTHSVGVIPNRGLCQAIWTSLEIPHKIPHIS